MIHGATIRLGEYSAFFASGDPTTVHVYAHGILKVRKIGIHVEHYGMGILKVRKIVEHYGMCDSVL